MYAYIKGLVTHVDKEYLILETGGIGYRLFVPTRCADNAQLDSTIQLFTHLVVREDAMTLYGFDTTEDLKMFVMLISVSGLGPKSAISLLSIMTCGEITSAVFAADYKSLLRASGIGKKTAERILLELKDKVSIESALTTTTGTISDTSPEIEAMEALLTLGYDKKEAYSALSAVTALADTTEDLILLALKRLSK